MMKRLDEIDEEYENFNKRNSKMMEKVKNMKKAFKKRFKLVDSSIEGRFEVFEDSLLVPSDDELSKKSIKSERYNWQSYMAKILVDLKDFFDIYTIKKSITKFNLELQ